MTTRTNNPYTQQLLVELTRRLLTSIVQGDWATYAELCDESLTAFEPEARGHLVEGLAFHKYYFDLGGSKRVVNATICSPHVRLVGDSAAVVSYVRLTQATGTDGVPATTRAEETRVWQRSADGNWRHVHFHRSSNT